jgi:hypothetical protein
VEDHGKAQMDMGMINANWLLGALPALASSEIKEKAWMMHISVWVNVVKSVIGVHG